MSATSFLDGRVTLHAGDSRDVLASLPDASIDSVVTDPPYALVSIGKRFGKDGAAPAIAGKTGAYARASAGFMGQQWDTGETAFAVEFWAQVFRVLKPGGHVAAFGGTRSYHRLACAIEDAGFEIRDQLGWCYGSGFPKSHDVAKGIDKLDAAAERRRRALDFTAWVRSAGLTARSINEATGTVMGSHYVTDKEQPLVATRQHMEMMRPLISVPVPNWVERLVDDREVESQNFNARPVIGQHDDVAHASKWRATYAGGNVPEAGAVTRAFTPEAQAWQGWGTALKPAWEPIVLARKPLQGTVAANVLAHGTGALNIDGCRVGTEGGTKGCDAGPSNGILGDGLNGSFGTPVAGLGRWPANIVHDGSAEVIAAFPSEAGGSGKASGPSLRGANRSVARGQFNGLPDGLEPAFYGDTGSAARFFYSAKADADDRIGHHRRGRLARGLPGRADRARGDISRRYCPPHGSGAGVARYAGPRIRQGQGGRQAGRSRAALRSRRGYRVMTRLSEAQIADLKERVDLADLAQSLGARLRRSGGRSVGSCPICGGGARATRFEIKASGWVCAVCEDGGDAIRLLRQATGCDFASAIERLGGARVLSAEEQRSLAAARAEREKRERAQSESYRRVEIAACRRIWDAGALPTPERLGRYHEARGLILPGSALIRQIDDLGYFHGEEIDETGRRQPKLVHRGPAQIAALIDNAGAFSGLHITWLRNDWSGKAEIIDPETGEILPAKKMRGSKKGAHIVLRTAPSAEIAKAQRDGTPIRLFMGEGIETVGQVGTSLKATRRLRGADAFWASGDLGNLGGAHLGTIAHPSLKTPKGRPQRVPGPDPDLDAPAIAIPPEVTHLCLLGDGDSEAFLTTTTLERARRRYARPGLSIGIAMAAAGTDFNSMRAG